MLSIGDRPLFCSPRSRSMCVSGAQGHVQLQDSDRDRCIQELRWDLRSASRDPCSDSPDFAWLRAGTRSDTEHLIASSRQKKKNATAFSKGPCIPHLMTWVPTSIPGMVFGNRALKWGVHGPLWVQKPGAIRARARGSRRSCELCCWFRASASYRNCGGSQEIPSLQNRA